MKQLTCKRVESILHDHLEGSLSEDESSAVEVHLAVCESCKQSADLWSSIATTASDGDLGPTSPRLERNLSARDWSLGPQRLTTGRKALIGTAIAGPLAAAAALAVVLGVGVEDHEEIGAPEVDENAVPQVAEAPVPPPPAPAPALEEKRVGAGDWRVFPVGPGNALWLGDDAVVKVKSVSEQGVTFALERGFALAEIQTLEPGFRFVVSTPNAEVEARGTVFSVAVEQGGGETVRVAEGSVEVRQTVNPGAPVLVSAGEQIDPGASSPRAATDDEVAADTVFLAERSGREVEVAAIRPNTGANGGPRHEPSDRGSPAELVARAQAERTSGDYRAAAATYEQVIARFPASQAASNSRVALGQMKLSAMARPQEAIRHFEAYLEVAPGGALAAEARVGVVRALARLGQSQRVIEAASQYLSNHPTGRAAAEVTRTRADAKRKTGDCKGALADYAAVLKTWPGSAEASRARSGMESCLDTSD
jgi:outer membrane protein assembly factor BamD (BamD/ComL family)